jgi:S-DNA-T family DNA segregation ATPase FtsK/SpoIIIE
MVNSKANTQVRTFFAKRFLELLGLLFFGIAIFLIAALTSYDENDPSVNLVNSAIIKNLGGAAGANVSDLALQYIGLGCLMLVIISATWGYKLFRKQGLPKIWVKITLLPLLLPLSAGMFKLLDYGFDKPTTWKHYYGGVIGDTLHLHIEPYITVWGYGAIFIIATFACLYYTLGLTKEQWHKIATAVLLVIQKIFDMVLWVLHILLMIKARLQALVEGDDYVAPQKPVRAEKPIEPKVRKKRASPLAKALKKAPAAPKPKKPRVISRKNNDDDNGSAPVEQTSFDLEMRNDYQLPPLDLLQKVKASKINISDSALSQNAELLENVLEEYGVRGKIIEVLPGPVVTLYALEPAPGTKSARVIGLADDIARSMSAESARIAVIPGRNAIGIELPNSERETVYLREMLGSDEFKKSKFKLPLALGKDIGGEPTLIDLAKTPHMLVAGTTGSGKSVGINAMILSLLYKYSPDECKFIMVDPKMLELSVYQDIPHLLTPVVTEPNKAVVALKWTVREMEQRYRLMSTLGVRNIAGYNDKIKEAVEAGTELTREVQTGFDPETGKPIMEVVPLDMNPLPFIVVIVDEMADLMMVGGKEIEISVQRLAQMARAAGIHVVLATQRPSVDVITGIIKANFPTRLSFQVSSKIDSRTIIGEAGAEQLLGMGDMLFLGGGNKLTRVHGPFVADDEVERVVNFIKKQASPLYIEEVTKDDEEGGAGEAGEPAGELDELYDKAYAIVVNDRKASTSYIQRSLRIGYNRAANIVDQLEREGVIGAANHVGKREILVGDD